MRLKRTSPLLKFGLIALLFVSVDACLAQSDRGSITGSLTDPTGNVIPAAPVTATNEARANLITRLHEHGLQPKQWPDLLWGAQARVDAATDPEVDFVMSAIVGVAGLEATYGAICAGKRARSGR